jgi:tRNA-2-methylthio-N6-dimethylallyladenosine synthase
MNYSDAERIATILEKLGLKPAFKNAASSSAEALVKADLIVFVTCGVRQSAENRVYGLISNLRKKYPKKKIILTGCLAHRKDVQRRLKNKVDLFSEIDNLTNKIKGIRNTKYEILNTKNKLCNDYLQLTPKYTSSYTAYIPIMTGCNNFCTYCVVPYARGREYSRPAKDILKEVESLLKKGYKEIVLLGQNVNSYKSSSVNFPKLLQLIEKIPGKFWLTFLTSHPKDMSNELIETIAKSKNICEYISLPAQSGDNEILRKMNRHYTIAHYKNLIKKIRRELSSRQTAISTDIIVGFPGETKKQFENTAKLFREMKFDMAYINQYSPRPETAAWKLKDNVSKKEKERRDNFLTEILKKTALENNKKYVGKIIEVLVDKKLDSSLNESLALRNDGGLAPVRKKPSFELKSLILEPTTYLSHTRTQKKVIFYANKKIPVGVFIKINITKVKAFGLEGKLI